MSMLRDGHYDSRAGSLCRRIGHSWVESRCTTCHIRTDSWAWPTDRIGTHADAMASAVPVGQMVTWMTQSFGGVRPSPPVGDVACIRSHVGRWAYRSNGNRRCLDCANELRPSRRQAARK